MLQATFSAFLEEEDIALLCRVLERLEEPGDSLIDHETRSVRPLQLFQSGVCDEEALIEAMARRSRD